MRAIEEVSAVPTATHTHCEYLCLPLLLPAALVMLPSGVLNQEKQHHYNHVIYTLVQLKAGNLGWSKL